MSSPCPKCGKRYTWDGNRCRNRNCRFGSGLPSLTDSGAVRRERFFAEGGRPAVAAWVPGWYELDQPLVVGMTAEFSFWRDVPELLRGPEPLVFHNSLRHAGEVLVAWGTIGAIRHPELGEVARVDTRGLDYRIVLVDQTEILVNAEEEPGHASRLVNGAWTPLEPQVRDWRFVVTFSTLAVPSPL